MRQPAALESSKRFALNLARASLLVWRGAPRLTAATVALVVIQSVQPLISLYLVKLTVDAVSTALGAADGVAALHSIFMLIMFAAGVALAGVVLSAIAGIIGEAQAQLVADYVQDVVHAKSIDIDLEYYDNSHFYDTLHRAQQEAPYRPGRITKGLISVCQNGLSLAAMTALLLSVHWSTTLLMLVAVAPEALVQLKYANTIYAWRRRRTLTERYAQYFDWMMTGSAHAQELRLFDLGRLFMRRYQEFRECLRRERFAIIRRRSAAALCVQSGATLAVFGAYAFITYRTVEGAMTLGVLIMYFQAFQRGQEFLKQFLHGLAELYEDNLFLTNLFEFLDLERKLIEPTHPKSVPRPMRHGIVFEGVSFYYGAKQVLAQVDLHIPAGGMVALVGENGSGKTTLIKLLARLYDPSAGRIMLDGIDLREFAPTALRREISVIFQDYVRYHLTARANVGFGSPDRALNADHIGAAVDMAGARELIHRLSNGFETVLGNWFEDGEELSVGEWQKVALARALLREAQIIVLDEPTSAMDANAEYELSKRFREVTAGRTTILISHRLSTIKMADRIYVMRAGHVVESGTHEELLKKAGSYAQLFTAQANGYR